MMKLIKAAAFTAALLASTSVAAQERYITHTSGIMTAYRCYHLAVASGAPEAQALLRLGDYEAMARRGLSATDAAELKGYMRRQSELDVRDFGSPAGAFKTLGCRTIAQSRIVRENPNQRIPPPQ